MSISAEGLPITVIDDSGDQRGSSFPIPPTLMLPALEIADIHISTLRPGHVRGNHYHVRRNETLIIVSVGNWTVHWDTGENTNLHQRTIAAGAAFISVPKYWSHAIHNTGEQDLQIFGLADKPYDSTLPDTFARPVVQA